MHHLLLQERSSPRKSEAALLTIFAFQRRIRVELNHVSFRLQQLADEEAIALQLCTYSIATFARILQSIFILGAEDHLGHRA